MLIRPLWIEYVILLYEYVLVTKKINILNFLNVYSVPSTGNWDLEKLLSNEPAWNPGLLWFQSPPLNPFTVVLLYFRNWNTRSILISSTFSFFTVHTPLSLHVWNILAASSSFILYLFLLNLNYSFHRSSWVIPPCFPMTTPLLNSAQHHALMGIPPVRTLHLLLCKY